MYLVLEVPKSSETNIGNLDLICLYTHEFLCFFLVFYTCRENGNGTTLILFCILNLEILYRCLLVSDGKNVKNTLLLQRGFRISSL